MKFWLTAYTGSYNFFWRLHPNACRKGINGDKARRTRAPRVPRRRPQKILWWARLTMQAIKCTTLHCLIKSPKIALEKNGGPLGLWTLLGLSHFHWSPIIFTSRIYGSVKCSSVSLLLFLPNYFSCVFLLLFLAFSSINNLCLYVCAFMLFLCSASCAIRMAAALYVFHQSCHSWKRQLKPKRQNKVSEDKRTFILCIPMQQRRTALHDYFL